jgi:hypothetical protein
MSGYPQLARHKLAVEADTEHTLFHNELTLCSLKIVQPGGMSLPPARRRLSGHTELFEIEWLHEESRVGCALDEEEGHQAQHGGPAIPHLCVGVEGSKHQGVLVPAKHLVERHLHSSSPLSATLSTLQRVAAGCRVSTPTSLIAMNVQSVFHCSCCSSNTVHDGALASKTSTEASTEA